MSCESMEKAVRARSIRCAKPWIKMRTKCLCGEPHPKASEEKFRSEIKERHGDSSTTTERRSLPTRACVNNAIIAKEHFRACFVEVNPVQLRGIRTLILSSQDLQIHHLRALSKNLFLFSSLKSVDLSDNQLDDSGSKEIRT